MADKVKQLIESTATVEEILETVMSKPKTESTTEADKTQTNQNTAEV